MSNKPSKQEIAEAIKEGLITDKASLQYFIINWQTQQKIKEDIPAVADIMARVKGDKGADGHTPTDEELLSLIRPLIPVVKDGHTPTDEELLKLIKPLIPKIKDGHTPTEKELLYLIEPLIPLVDTSKITADAQKGAYNALLPKIPTIEQITKELPPDERIDIVEKINTGKKDDLKIDADQIKDLPEFIERSPNRGMGLSRATADSIYITGDGVRKITVGLITPVNPQIGDLWVDCN
jgi:hypothetical protein